MSADPALWPRLAALHAAAFVGERPWGAEALRSLAEAPGALLVLGGSAPLQGFALARTVVDEAELLTLAVRPEARRRGLAARLLAEVERRACSAGAATLFLEVARGNAPALGLYRARGFTECGLRRGYYGPSPAGDALLLSKPI